MGTMPERIILPPPIYDYDEFDRAYFPIRGTLEAAVQRMYSNGYPAEFIMSRLLCIDKNFRMEDVIKLQVERVVKTVRGKTVARSPLTKEFKKTVRELMAAFENSSEKVLEKLHEEGHTELVIEDIKHLRQNKKRQ